MKLAQTYCMAPAKNRGFTLVEIIVTLVIFTIASVMLLNGFVFAINMYKDSVRTEQMSDQVSEAIDINDPSLVASAGSINFYDNNGVSYEITGDYITAEITSPDGKTVTRKIFR